MKKGRKFRFGLSSVLFGMLLVGMSLTAWRRFQITITSPEGLAAGTMMAAIGFIVGQIVGGISGPRHILLGVSAVAFLAITQGFFDEQQESVLWAMTAMSWGMLAGALRQPTSSEVDTHEPEHRE